MSYPRLIPCLDIAAGRVVKCVRFENQRDIGDPIELGKAYAQGGADELVFLDIEATLAQRETMLDVVRRIADNINIPFTVGGGLRKLEDAVAFVESGADRVSLNSAAISNPELVTALANRYGSQAVIVAIDAKGGIVHSHAGTRPTELEASQWAYRAQELGAGEILLTSIDADGTRAGYDMPVTQRVAEAVNIPVIASGGAGSAQHVADVLQVVSAALIASIVHDDPANLPELRQKIIACGVSLRPMTRESAGV